MKFKVKTYNVCALFVCEELEYYHYTMIEEEKDKLVEYYDNNRPEKFDWYYDCDIIMSDLNKTQLKLVNNLWTAQEIIDIHKQENIN